jgi:N-acetylglutamate synthase-like GNAT family acetyltransferase
MGQLKWTLRHTLRPGDLGYLITLHGTVYAQEYGYDTTFEAYVAQGIAEFINSLNPRRDRIWLAESDRSIVGSIAIVGRSRRQAQLRWFLVHSAYRGRGIGNRLLKVALRFCKHRKYKSIFLWTTSELDAARYLYTACGFRKTSEKTHRIWGKVVKEEKYELLTS